MSVAVPKEDLNFFKKLEKNNNRNWFNERKKEFKAIEAEIKNVYNSLFEDLKVHDEIDKVKMFRIYRDVRFSSTIT